MEDEAFVVNEEGVLNRRVGIEDLPGLIQPCRCRLPLKLANDLLVIRSPYVPPDLPWGVQVPVLF